MTRIFATNPAAQDAVRQPSLLGDAWRWLRWALYGETARDVALDAVHAHADAPATASPSALFKCASLLLLWAGFAYALQAHAMEAQVTISATVAGPGVLHVVIAREGDEKNTERRFHVEPGVGSARLALVDLPEGTYRVQTYFMLADGTRLPVALRQTGDAATAGAIKLDGNPDLFAEPQAQPTRIVLRGAKPDLAIALGDYRAFAFASRGIAASAPRHE